MTPATGKIPSYAHSAFSLNDKVHNLIHEDNVNPFLPQNLNEKKMRIVCNVLIFKYYIKNRALWSIPVFIKKVNDMQVFLFISTIFVF